MPTYFAILLLAVATGWRLLAITYRKTKRRTEAAENDRYFSSRCRDNIRMVIISAISFFLGLQIRNLATLSSSSSTQADVRSEYMMWAPDEIVEHAERLLIRRESQRGRRRSKSTSPRTAQEVKIHLNQVANTLKAVPIRYYIYDDLIYNTAALSARNGRYDKFSHEEENDKQMILALEQSSLRTFNATDADLFIPPIPMTTILMSNDPDFSTPMKALLEHPIFQSTQGNNHLLISTCFALHRHRYKDYTQMNHFYHRIYNMTIVQSWDPVAVHNELFHSNVNWGDYHSTFVNEEPVSLSRRSISVGLGSGNHHIPLTLATMERFHSSNNFIFYHSRREASFNNSTIHRHGPITNITFETTNNNNNNNNKHNGNFFPRSSIGWGLNPYEWLYEFSRSQFCLTIRGDSPHSHSLWRSIRVGCIPVIVSKHLPVYAPMFKSTLNMSDYAVILDEEEMLRNPTETLLKLREMSYEEIEMKIMHLAFAQKVIFTDHPESLFVPALLKEAIMAEEVMGLSRRKKNKRKTKQTRAKGGDVSRA
jgi:hypothetical protein